MKKHKPRILFTEKSPAQQQALRFYLEDYGAEVYFCNRKSAIIDEIKRINADMVVLDSLLTITESIEIKHICTDKKLSPKLFIAVSSFDNEGAKTLLASSGFDAVLIKPFDYSILLQKLRTVFGDNFGVKYIENDAEKNTDKILQQLYMPGNLSGRIYLRQAIALAVCDPQILQRMTSRLYPKIAELNNTTAANVERSMRNAIKITWERGNSEVFEKYFRYRTSNICGRPTNREFIEVISDKLRSELETSKLQNN